MWSEFVRTPTPPSLDEAKLAVSAVPVPESGRSRALVALAVAGAGLPALAWSFIRRRRRRATLPAHAVIVSPRKSTSIAHDGAVLSGQCAELTVSAEDLDRLWNPTNLENLASTYWRFLTKVTLGIVRVRYTDDSRSVMLLGRPLVLLRFDLPEYEFEADHGRVTWKIRDGLLVARAGRHSEGLLKLDVRRLDAPCDPGQAKLRIEVEVSNFYPSIASGFSTPVYEFTQSFIHVLVTHGFLRSLATLKLVESKVGRFALQA
jgi:hypothetical protein